MINMTRLLAPMAIAVAVAALLSAGVPSAHACSCVVRTTQAYLDGADVVAVGTIIRLIDDKDIGDGPNDLDARVSVARYLKGSGPAEITVDDPPSGGTCGFLDDGDLGKTYLLFLTGSDSPFESNLCSGNTLLVGPAPEDGQGRLDEVEALTGPGAPPNAGPAPSQSGTDVPWLAIGLGSGLGAALLLAASIIVVRRRIIGGG